MTDPSHPTQLYSSALSLLVLGAVLYLRPRLLQPGQLFASYLVFYSVGANSEREADALLRWLETHT